MAIVVCPLIRSQFAKIFNTKYVLRMTVVRTNLSPPCFRAKVLLSPPTERWTVGQALGGYPNDF